MEAAYYDNIIEQQRIEPEFFRMGFYGRKFPFFLRVRLATPIQSCDTPPTASDTLRNPLMQLSHAESGRRCRSQRGWKKKKNAGVGKFSEAEFIYAGVLQAAVCDLSCTRCVF